MNKPPRLIAYALMLLMAVTPLVWLRPFESGITPFHIAALVLMAMIPFVGGSKWALVNTYRSGKIIWLSSAALVLLAILFLAKSLPPVEPAGIAKSAFYLASGFAVAITVALLTIRGGLTPLAWTPMVVGLTFVFMLFGQLTANGIDPIAALSVSIARGDPNDMIYQLFKGGISSEELEFRANIRHGFALALLPAMALGHYAMRFIPQPSFVVKSALMGGTVLCLGLVIFSFSRSAWLALVLMGLCLSIPLLFSARKMMFAGYLAILAMPVALVFSGPVLSLISARVANAQSYSGRMSEMNKLLGTIKEAPLLGRSASEVTAAHNIVIDNWATLGLPGLVASLFMLSGVALLIIVLCVKSLQAHNPRMAYAAAFLCPALTRMVSAPFGRFEMGVWISVGIGVAVIAALHLPEAVREVRPSRKLVRVRGFDADAIGRKAWGIVGD